MKDTSLPARASLISEALIRVAASITRPALRARFESGAVDLISAVSLADAEAAKTQVNLLKALMGLAASIYELETINEKILLGELTALEAGLQEQPKSNFSNIEELFMDQSRIAPEPFSKADKFQSANQLPIELPDELPIAEGIADSVVDEENQEKIPENNAMVSIATAIRQSAILEKIRTLSVRDGQGQMIGCKMKDLLATFPDVSERTIRNDLLRLVNRGSVERLGTGGATSAYVIK